MVSQNRRWPFNKLLIQLYHSSLSSADDGTTDNSNPSLILISAIQLILLTTSHLSTWPPRGHWISKLALFVLIYRFQSIPVRWYTDDNASQLQSGAFECLAPYRQAEGSSASAIWSNVRLNRLLIGYFVEDGCQDVLCAFKWWFCYIRRFHHTSRSHIRLRPSHHMSSSSQVGSRRAVRVAYRQLRILQRQRIQNLGGAHLNQTARAKMSATASFNHTHRTANGEQRGWQWRQVALVCLDQDTAVRQQEPSAEWKMEDGLAYATH